MRKHEIMDTIETMNIPDLVAVLEAVKNELDHRRHKGAMI